MARVTSANIKELQEVLIDWYSKMGRRFSWRADNLTPYHYVIAEVLLQRTKAETVENFINSFLIQFPDWKSLANSVVETIEISLKPIGLQKQRANRVRQLAVEMVKREGIFPSHRSELEQIPFLGQYIANATELLVFKRARPLLDVNMARLLERYFSPRKMADLRYDPKLQALAQRVVLHSNNRIINWAILDFSALVCRPRPRCEICPLSKNCTYFKKEIINKN
jgi:A/G-specific adenine glycosylase